MRKNSNVREILGYVSKLRDTPVLIAPSRIGPVTFTDRQMFLYDLRILEGLGLRISVAEYADSNFWQGMDWPDNLPKVSVRDDRQLIDLAGKLRAQKLCLIAGSDRIVVHGKPLDDIPLAVVEKLLSEHGDLNEAGRHALQLSVEACHAGVSRVHVFNVHRDGALLCELFTNDGMGTMIHCGTPHKEVRHVLGGDLAAIQGLLAKNMPRNTVSLALSLRDELRIFSVDGDVHGIARISMRDNLLMIRQLAHTDRSNAAEVLERLMRAAMDEARVRNADQVVLLADEIPALMRILPWFTGLGFAKGRVLFGELQHDAWVKKAQ